MSHAERQSAQSKTGKRDEVTVAPAPLRGTDADADARATTSRPEAATRATTSRDDTDARGQRRMIAAIAVMLVLFAVVVTFRREIRVRWWAHRLMATQDMHEHAYYLGLLATEPERAAAAAERLMRSDDAALRSFGVALAVRVPGSRGDALLERALHDADPAVRRGAIQGISVRPSSDVVELLRGLTDDPDIDTAMWATYSLGNTVDPAAADALRELAVNHPHAGVRAQAIMMLGQWRDEATIAALTACLDDDAVIECAVPSEQAALEALEQAAPQLASQAEMPHEAGLSNAERAAQVLEAMGP